LNTAPGGNAGTLVPGVLGPMWTSTGLEPSLNTTFALDFDPSNPDYVDGGNINLSSTSSGGAASVSMWIRPDVLSADMRIYGQLSLPTSQGGSMGSLADGSLRIWDGSAWLGAAPAGTLTAGNWHHLSMVWTSDSVNTYVNGALKSTITSDFDFGAADGNFGIGARFADTYGTGFEGLIDEVAIYSVAISTDLITALAAGAPAIAPPVPEPSTFGRVALALGIMARRRRNGRHRNDTK
jgi:hypothetical protein